MRDLALGPENLRLLLPCHGLVLARLDHQRSKCWTCGPFRSLGVIATRGHSRISRKGLALDFHAGCRHSRVVAPGRMWGHEKLIVGMVEVDVVERVGYILTGDVFALRTKC